MRFPLSIDVLYIYRGAGHGGDAIMTIRLAAAVQARGFAVRCMISPAESNSADFIAAARKAGLHVDQIEYFSANRTTSRSKLLSALYKYVWRIRPRVVHVHTCNAYLNPSFALVLALAHRGRRVLTLHASKSWSMGKAQLRDQDVGERFFTSIIVPSEFSRALYIECSSRTRAVQAQGNVPKHAQRLAFEPQIIAIPNLVETIAPKPNASADIRHELSLDAKSKIVLSMSRITEAKGVIDTISAFVRISEFEPDAVLLIAGMVENAEYRIQCIQAAASVSNRVRWLGHRLDIVDIMSAATVHILSSFHESFGMSILEAMTLGVPTIAYNLPSIAEIAGDAAILCPLHDVDALSDGLRTLLGDSALRNRLSVIGKARTRKLYDKCRIVDDHIQAYGLQTNDLGCLSSQRQAQ